MSCGASWFWMKSISGLRTDHVVAAPHVVVVEEDARRGGRRAAPPRAARRRRERISRRRRRVDLRRLVDLHDRERLDRLRLAVFLDPELVLLEVEHRVALPVGDDDVDADEVDAGPDAAAAAAAPAAASRCRRRRLCRRLLAAAVVRGRLLGLRAAAPTERRTAARAASAGGDVRDMSHRTSRAAVRLAAPSPCAPCLRQAMIALAVRLPTHR